MSAQVFEIVLARLYSDSEFRQLFLREPLDAIAEYELSTDEISSLLAIDKAGLVMASNSIEHKLAKRKRHRPKNGSKWAAMRTKLAQLLKRIT